MATIDRIIALLADTSGCWDMAVDTAESHGPDPDRRGAAERDRGQALEAWDAAIGHVRAGRLGPAVEELQGAAALAASWGDDSFEREAIALLDRDADLAAADALSGTDDPVADECAAACREAWRA